MASFGFGLLLLIEDEAAADMLVEEVRVGFPCKLVQAEAVVVVADRRNKTVNDAVVAVATAERILSMEQLAAQFQMCIALATKALMIFKILNCFRITKPILKICSLDHQNRFWISFLPTRTRVLGTT